MVWGVYACVYFCVVCCLRILQRAALHSEGTTLFGLSLKELVPERFSRTHVCPQVSLGHSVYFTVCAWGVLRACGTIKYVHVHVCVHCTVYVRVHVLVRCTDHKVSLPLDIQIL